MSDVQDVVEELATKHLRWWRRSSDDEITGPCPFHDEASTGAFHINTQTGMFICFSCQERGGLFSLMKKLRTPRVVIDAVMRRVEGELDGAWRKKKKKGEREPFLLHEALLGVFDRCPTSLLEDGFNMDLLRAYDIGFDTLHGRITYPIRDHHGRLVGISGRTLDGSLPKYKIYMAKQLCEFNDKAYGGYYFIRGQFLWNMHNVIADLRAGDVKRLNIVEGFKACLWMLQNGYRHTVASLGVFLTRHHLALLDRYNVAVNIFLDNTEDARAATAKMGKQLSPGHDVYVSRYPRALEDGCQPDDLPKKALQLVVENALNYGRWRSEWMTTQI